MKEIIRELKIQREVDFHNNIIRCYGITKLESENHNNCQLVMEYANGGTLRSYLKENFTLEISQGLRETIVPGTPNEYVKVYTKCWDGEPDNRPTIYQVVDWLNGMITKIDINHHQISNKEINEAYLSNNNSESQGDLSQLIQDFDRINIKEVDPMINE
ncbi:unnamed protein product [Rhizophagus irregularis]|nr:unnamed protein product [Rhizophagus irregularis]